MLREGQHLRICGAARAKKSLNAEAWSAFKDLRGSENSSNAEGGSAFKDLRGAARAEKSLNAEGGSAFQDLRGSENSLNAIADPPQHLRKWCSN